MNTPEQNGRAASTGKAWGVKIFSAPDRLEVTTSDFDEAVESLRSVFGDADLRRNESATAGLTLRSVRSDDLDATRWAVRGATGASLDQDDRMHSGFLTGLRLGGDVVAWGRDHGIDTDRPFVYPHHVNSRFDEADIANLAISVDAVTAAARTTTGGANGEVRFTDTAPIERSNREYRSVRERARVVEPDLAAQPHRSTRLQ